MSQPEGIRPYVPPQTEKQFDPVEFGHICWRLGILDDPEHGTIPKLVTDVSGFKEKWSRLIGAAWCLIIINGIMGFVATVATIYSALK